MSARKLQPLEFSLQPSILWLIPQQLAEIRLQYDIGEMLAHRRPMYPLSRSTQRTAKAKAEIRNSES